MVIFHSFLYVYQRATQSFPNQQSSLVKILRPRSRWQLSGPYALPPLLWARQVRNGLVFVDSLRNKKQRVGIIIMTFNDPGTGKANHSYALQLLWNCDFNANLRHILTPRDSGACHWWVKWENVHAMESACKAKNLCYPFLPPSGASQKPEMNAIHLISAWHWHIDGMAWLIKCNLRAHDFPTCGS